MAHPWMPETYVLSQRRFRVRQGRDLGPGEERGNLLSYMIFSMLKEPKTRFTFLTLGSHATRPSLPIIAAYRKKDEQER
jgi:hypothetical protein